MVNLRNESSSAALNTWVIQTLSKIIFLFQLTCSQDHGLLEVLFLNKLELNIVEVNSEFYYEINLEWHLNLHINYHTKIKMVEKHFCKSKTRKWKMKTYPDCKSSSQVEIWECHIPKFSSSFPLSSFLLNKIFLSLTGSLLRLEPCTDALPHGPDKWTMNRSHSVEQKWTTLHHMVFSEFLRNKMSSRCINLANSKQKILEHA